MTANPKTATVIVVTNLTETLCKIKIRMTSRLSNSCTCANLSVKSATATHFGIL